MCQSQDCVRVCVCGCVYVCMWNPGITCTVRDVNLGEHVCERVSALAPPHLQRAPMSGRLAQAVRLGQNRPHCWTTSQATNTHTHTHTHNPTGFLGRQRLPSASGAFPKRREEECENKKEDLEFNKNKKNSNNQLNVHLLIRPFHTVSDLNCRVLTLFFS